MVGSNVFVICNISLSVFLFEYFWKNIENICSDSKIRNKGFSSFNKRRNDETFYYIKTFLQ